MNEPSLLFRLKHLSGLLLTSALLIVTTGCDQTETTADQPRAAKPHLVAVAPVEERALGETLVRSGTLRARRLVRLHSQEAGRIEQLPVFEGDHVAEGDLLMALDNRLLQAELNKAQATLHQAEQDLKRARRLSGQNLVSQDELSRAETAVQVARAEVSLLKTRLGYTRIHAPFAGVITERMVEPGDAVTAYAHVLTLADPASLITEVTLSELLVTQLAIGDTVQVRIDALGDEQFEGRINRIHPTIDPATRQGIVEVLLEPVPPGARAGQLCRVEITTRSKERRVMPITALRRDNQGDFVYTVEDGKAKRQGVRIGLTIGEYIELLDGPAAGIPVITRGFLGLSPGRPVTLPGKGAADGNG